MGLQTYRRKRNFRNTPEPPGKSLSSSQKDGRSYLIQKHSARQLHYDLRLELNGVLLSWAVPKGPSLDPHERRLAVHVEDHPIEYGDFEGIIPPGQYGSGTVLLWDRGQWQEKGNAEEGLRKGRLKFQLQGEKLRGGWTLVRMNGKAAEEDKENWLLIKEKDREADPTGKKDILHERPESVTSGRTLEEVRAAADRQWQSDAKQRKKKSRVAIPKRRGAADAKIEPRALAGARPSPLPDFIPPQMAFLSEETPAGNDWLHEIKFDGYRALCRIAKGKAVFYTREGNDWTARFAKLAQAATALPVREALLDGEVVVLQSDGTTSFQALQNLLSEEDDHELTYFVFDVLHLNGYDLTSVPLLARKEALAKLIPSTDQGFIRYSTHVIGHGATLYKEACEHGLEGMISKRIDQPYRSGRRREWLKIKCRQSQEFVIGGFSDPSGTRKGFGALLLGVFGADGEFLYCGRVGTGFNEKSLAEVHARLKNTEQRNLPFSNWPKGLSRRGVHWVAPQLVVEVEFIGWTKDNIVRQASFKGLREDKPADTVKREKPVAEMNGAATKVRSAKKGKEGHSKIAGIQLTHPDRVLYPGQGITKRELALYYEKVAEWILPELQDRPLSLVRCPQGHNHECFYQKHANESMDESIKRVKIREEEKVDTYLTIDSLQALISLVQLGVLEFHTWGARADQIERPDRLIFDLDPDEKVTWRRVIDAAFVLRERLEDLGFGVFVKTSGGKGLHLVVPLQRRHGWDEVKEFSRLVAQSMVRDEPERFTATMSKAKRKGKIFIDHFRNGRGATAVAAYSSRAKPGAPVSTPVSWQELNPELRADQYNVRNLPRRLEKLGNDPWRDYEKARRTLTAAMKKMQAR